MTAMDPELPRRVRGSASTVLRVGIGLGLLLTLGIASLLHYDRELRMQAGYRQIGAIATGVDRLLQANLGNLERALRGLSDAIDIAAAAAPEDAGALLDSTIRRMLARHPQLDSLVQVDAQGNALSSGRGDPGFAAWRANAVMPSGLLVGPLEADGSGGWWLRLARPSGSGKWLLARLKTTAIEAMIRDLDVGRDGNVTVLDRRGVVLARLPQGAGEHFTGRPTRLPESLATGGGTRSDLRVSQIDGIERLAAFSGTSGYGVAVVAGLGLHELLAPWYRNAVIGLALVLLYWLALAYLFQRLSVGERVRESLLYELEEQAGWLDQAQHASRTGVWRTEGDGESLRVSAHTAAMYGLPPGDAVKPVAEFLERIHPEDRAEVREAFARTLATGVPYSAEYRVLTRTGVERWVRDSGGVVTDRQGRRRITGTVLDVTSQHEARERVERADAQFRALFDRNPLPFWVVDEESQRFVAVNETAVATYGYSEDEFRAMTIRDLRSPAGAAAPGQGADGEPSARAVDGVWTHYRSDGSAIDVRVFSSAIAFGGRQALLVLAEDISDRVAYERDLAWRANHDSLTGLPLLTTLVDRLCELHVAATRYVVAFLRLRDLELVAPTLGSQISQLIVREVAARVSVVGREYGLVGFWPGECFVIVARDADRCSDMLAALEEVIGMPVETAGGAHPISATIGFAEGPEADEGPEQVIGHAALAALQALQEQVPVLRYDRDMGSDAAERLALVARLREAVEQEAFELHYQPIHRLSDGALVSIEALLRWRMDGNPVSPALFVPLAEASGMIVPLGRWVLEQAARCHGQLVERGRGGVSIAVNVSAVQLFADNVPELVLALQRKYALPRDALHVELTESTVVRNPQAARTRMHALREAGVVIAIDDFGTGFSSMAYLRDLPLDCLKIDRSFVQNVDQDERNASICRALIALAQGLGLGTVAEGVERPGELEWLRDNGCELAQGYLLGRPVPLHELLDAVGDGNPR